jgi:plastocyanin
VLTSITVSGGGSVLTGATLQLSAVARDQNGGTMSVPFTWSSGNTAVATVNGNGVVTGLTVGTANISASSGAVSGSLSVSVANATPTNAATVEATNALTFTPATVVITRGGTVTWNFAATQHNVSFSGGTGAPTNIGNTANTSVSRVFNSAGTFDYNCTLHFGMSGQVVVQ